MPGVNNSTERPLQSNTTELSFLDILLSDDEDDTNEEPLLHNGGTSNSSGWTNYSSQGGNSTIYASDSSTSDHDRYALIDEQITYETTVPPYIVHSVKDFELSNSPKISNYDRSATENIIKQYITYTSVPNYDSGSPTSVTNQYFETSTLTESTTQEQASLSPAGYDTYHTIEEENSNNWSTSSPTYGGEISSDVTSDSPIEIEEYTSTPTTISYDIFDNNETGQITTTEPSLVSTFFEEFSNLFGDQNSFKKVESRPQNIEQQSKTTTTLYSDVTTQSPPTPKTTRRVNPTIISSPAYPRWTSPTEKESSTPMIVTITATKPTPSSTRTTSAIPSTTNSKSPTTTSTPITKVVVSTTSKTSTTASSPTTKPSTTTTLPSTTLPPPTTTPGTTPPIIFKPTYTDNANKHQTTPKITLATPSQANNPSLFDSNPSILDSDLNYDYGDQPTLPPSLPNLKIIPFLPTDAVRKDSSSNFDYFPNNPTSYPVLTENYENPFLNNDNLPNQNTDFTAFEVDESEGNVKDSINRNNDNSDFNSYNIESTGYSNDPIFGIPNTNAKSSEYDQYPSITEKPNVEHTLINKYPAYSKYNVDYDYDSFDPAKHAEANKYVPGSYEVINGHDYSVQGRNPSFDKFVTERHVFSKIEFSTSNPLFGYNGDNKFSPPSKTEGMIIIC